MTLPFIWYIILEQKTLTEDLPLKGFYKGLLAASGLFAAYVVGTGVTVYVNAMKRSSKHPDRNYDPDEEKDYIVPGESSSAYRHGAYNYNIWWKFIFCRWKLLSGIFFIYNYSITSRMCKVKKLCVLRKLCTRSPDNNSRLFGFIART